MSAFQELANEAIRLAGGRITAQRQLLIELLDTTEISLDAEALYHLARQRDQSINLATVYRTLHILEDAGIIQRRYLSQDHERNYYEPAHLEAEYHFTCRACKQVIAFGAEYVRTLQRQLEKDFGVVVTNACVCFSGLCPDCQKQENQR